MRSKTTMRTKEAMVMPRRFAVRTTAIFCSRVAGAPIHSRMLFIAFPFLAIVRSEFSQKR